jgi:branched-chain amino acid transport system permease protein
MKPNWRRWLRFDRVFLVVAALLPFLVAPGSPRWVYGTQLTAIFIWAILALGLNVIVGYTGLLNLGIAAFFGIGAYITGILTVPSYPFQVGFWAALAIASLGTAVVGILLAGPTLRLRGDYLAIVTLGFGEVVRYTLRNLEGITGGMRSLNPVPPPHLPDWFASVLTTIGFTPNWMGDYRLFYYLTLGLLAIVIWVLTNLEHSKLGRTWVAVREDELAATCMGINAARVKLSAFALGTGLAGAAGCLYVTYLTNTADPNAYGFNVSITVLCCIILGGLGSIRGTLLGVFLLKGFETIGAQWIDRIIQEANINPDNSRFLKFSSWNMMIFGLALILMMRFRPEGLLPSSRVKRELHTEQPLTGA